MTKDEALKMAIEQIEWANSLHDWHDGLLTALQDCKEALEQPTQEPVAWMHNGEVYLKKQCKFFSKDMGKEFEGQTPLYTHPKEWQRISQFEINDISDAPGFQNKDNLYEFARAIEATLKEKNT